MRLYCALACALILLSASPVVADLIQWSAAEGGNGHWYGLTAPGTWPEAEAEAVLAAGHLVTVNDGNEDQWLYDTFHPLSGFIYLGWLGFYQDTGDPAYSEPSGGWKWISGEPITYTNWGGGEPNDQNGGENWAVLTQGFPPHWNDWGPNSIDYPPGGIPGIIEVVPEPTTLLMLVFCALLPPRRRR